ncbi:MAG: NUDIX domain-containing protein [Ktedonobacterales bacterium]
MRQAHTPPPGQDNPDELFDLVDREDQVIGVVRRGEAHGHPALIHRSVQVLVFNAKGELLLQRRSQRKDLFPGYWCASASGHVDRGEDYATAAARELHEELGIARATSDLAWLGKTLVVSEPETEITTVFLAHADGPFTFHPTETAGGAFSPLAVIAAGRAEGPSGSLPMTPALLAALDLLLAHTPSAPTP